MKNYRLFKKKHRVIHTIVVAVAIVMLWRGVWGILDLYLFPDNEFASYVVGVIVALLVLYLDDFSLKELK